MSKKGLVHVYYGDGKGKTTAALGLAIRAAGSGNRVVIVQFLKNWKCGEHSSIELISNITLLQGKTTAGKFIHEMSNEEKAETRSLQEQSLTKALELIKSGQCDILVLDEIIDAIDMGVLDEKLFNDAVYGKPDSLELIITGHNPDGKLLGHADYVTEMIKRKHPFDKGINARKGIEY